MRAVRDKTADNTYKRKSPPYAYHSQTGNASERLKTHKFVACRRYLLHEDFRLQPADGEARAPAAHQGLRGRGSPVAAQSKAKQAVHVKEQTQAVKKTHIHHIHHTHIHHIHYSYPSSSHLFLHTTNPLQHTRCVSRPHILYNISTTLIQHSTVYSSTAVLRRFTVYNLYNTPLGSSGSPRDSRARAMRAAFRAGSGRVLQRASAADHRGYAQP